MRPRSVPARTAVVLSGGAVLVVETLAARLVAPYVGLTLETYTAAIGVALLGIALGARIGGALADRTGPGRVIAGALLGGGALVLLARPIILLLGPYVPAGPMSAIVLVGISTLPAVTVLSAAAPAAVRQRLHDLKESGGVVGEMSALGTLGALAGTLLTGYVLVATLPTSLVLAIAGAACVVLGIVVARVAAVPRVEVVSGAVAACVAATALVAVQSPCDVETAYYCATVRTDPDRASGRELYLDDLRHAYVDLDDPTHLEITYVQRFAAVIDAAYPAGEAVDVVHLGGGGFSMPRWLAATRPGSRSRVLEVDPAVVELGRDRLAVGSIPDMDVVIGDARPALRDLPTDSADVIIGDAFGSQAPPWHLATREFLADVDRVLRPRGVVALNVIDLGPKAFLGAEARTLAAVMPETAVLARPDQFTARGGGNFILVGSGEPLPLAELASLAAERGEPGSVVSGNAYDVLADGAPLLTDDYAPVEQLVTPFRTR